MDGHEPWRLQGKPESKDLIPATLIPPTAQPVSAVLSASSPLLSPSIRLLAVLQRAILARADPISPALPAVLSWCSQCMALSTQLLQQANSLIAPPATTSSSSASTSSSSAATVSASSSSTAPA